MRIEDRLKNQHGTIKQLIKENEQLKKKGKCHWIVQCLDSGIAHKNVWIDFSVGSFKWMAIIAYETEFIASYDEDHKNGTVRCIKVFESA